MYNKIRYFKGGRTVISVVIPTYNRADKIENALNSVLDQTYRDIEALVVDDCSTDDTGEVIRGIRDPRVVYIRLEKNSGAVIYAKNATEAHYPASVTKILTALMACERLPLGQEISMSRTAIESLTPGASNIALNVGEIITVEDALYAVMLPSANEAANGLAEAAAGSIEDFTVEMNERCRDLGVVNTRFVNCNGLHDENHYSCAYDLALIFAECVDNPTFLQIAHAYNHIIPPTNKQPEKRAIKTTDKMLNPYEK